RSSPLSGGGGIQKAAPRSGIILPERGAACLQRALQSVCGFPADFLRFSCGGSPAAGGQRDGEGDGVAGAGSGDGPAVGFDDLPGDGQPQPGAPRPGPAGAVQPEKLLEQPVQLFGRDGAALVLEGQG